MKNTDDIKTTSDGYIKVCGALEDDNSDYWGKEIIIPKTFLVPQMLESDVLEQNARQG